MLSLRGIEKRFGETQAVAAFDLDVAPGELVCLLGPSGSGKSTVLRMVGGFERPTAGAVLIDGQDMTRTPPERRPTSMMFQSHVLWSHMTVAVNIGFGLRLKGLSRAEVARRTEEALTLVGLAGLGARRTTQLSGGQQQRVALARSLVLEPKVLLLDEPFASLDQHLRERLIAPVRDYLAIARSVSAPLVVDDAHGLGILGETGAGVFEHSGITDTSGAFLIGSLSKALGCQGALIGMTSDQKAKIKGYSPIYNSISLPTMATIAAGHRALELARNRQYRKNISRLRGDVHYKLGQLGIDIADSGTPIVTFSLGSKAKNDAVFEQLYQQGILIIRSDYVGAPNEGALRITIMASHSQNDIERLCAAIQGALAVASE